MVSGISRMDSKGWQTPRFIYGKVLEHSGRFRVKPRKSGIFQKGGNRPALGWFGPTRAGRIGLAELVWGRTPSLPNSVLGWKKESSLFPIPYGTRTFPLMNEVEFEKDWTRVRVGFRYPAPLMSSFIYGSLGAAKDTPSPQPRATNARCLGSSPVCRCSSSSVRVHAVDLRFSLVIAGTLILANFEGPFGLSPAGFAPRSSSHRRDAEAISLLLRLSAGTEKHQRRQAVRVYHLRDATRVALLHRVDHQD
jgi:hypothetical protein